MPAINKRLFIHHLHALRIPDYAGRKKPDSIRMLIFSISYAKNQHICVHSINE
jgi:hypothetical protein